MKRVHLIGIGGTGLSAIAWVLAEKGYAVTGSDRALSPLAAALRELGVPVQVGHRAENVRGAQLVVRSSAIGDDNPEVQAARAAGIPVLKRAEFLSELMAGQVGVAVAGTHGKTTTTAMIAWVLTALGQDPSYIVGGVMKNLGRNAHAGLGPVFVIEADEYDRMFHGLEPWLAVVTNIEHDHPDCYPTPEAYREAFLEFARRVQPGGALLFCADDAGSRAAAQLAQRSGVRVLSYGLTEPADYQAANPRPNGLGGYDFDFMAPGKPAAAVRLQVPGEHNVRNALAAMAASHLLGLAAGEAAKALADFQGAGRRFETLGEVDGITLVNDYAHHPTAIRATLAAARARYPGRRIWAVWQPHTYSRTRSLAHEFASAFEDADRVIVTEVYAAREANPGFSARQVVEAMDRDSALFLPRLEDVTALLLNELAPGDVLLVLSAGDAELICGQVLDGLRERVNHG